MEIYDTILASQVEDEDQVLIDGDPVEVWTSTESTNDPHMQVIRGLSNNSGDEVTYTIPFDQRVDLWAV